MNASRLAARAAGTIAVLLALAIARRRREHRPIAAVIGVPLALDVLRASFPLPYEPALLSYLAWPLLAAWGALRVLVGITPRAAALALVPSSLAVLWCLAFAPPGALLRGSHAWALVVQVAAGAAWWASPARRDVSALCALVLAVGDVLAAALGPVLAGGPWDLARWQAAAVAGVLCALQGQELARTRGAME